MNYKFKRGNADEDEASSRGHLDFVVDPQESRCKSSFAEVILLYLRMRVGIMWYWVVLSCLVLCRGVILVSFVVNFEELGDGRSHLHAALQLRNVLLEQECLACLFVKYGE
jgi:hypothetical protein